MSYCPNLWVVPHWQLRYLFETLTTWIAGHGETQQYLVCHAPESKFNGTTGLFPCTQICAWMPLIHLAHFTRVQLLLLRADCSQYKRLLRSQFDDLAVRCKPIMGMPRWGLSQRGAGCMYHGVPYQTRLYQHTAHSTQFTVGGRWTSQRRANAC